MSQINVNEIYDGNGTDSAKLYGVSMRYGGTNFVNRIINGDMRIDQRNNGASVTPASSTYTLDRWRLGCSQASKLTVQQVSSAPTGFVNSTRITVASAFSPSAGDEFWYQQRIEGFNVSDLAFGSASASTVTISFWVNSSVTGTYSVSLQNNATNYSYVGTITVNAANTWEYKTLTVTGAPAGTWTTDNSVGLYLNIDLGSGSSLNTTAGSWQSGYFRRTSGSVSFVANAGATLNITGVQLEAGSVATPFERRPYGTELALCQRYFQIRTSGSGTAANATTFVGTVPFAVDMRASPTVGLTAALQVTDMWSADYTQSSPNISIPSARVSTSGVNINSGNFSGMTQARPSIINIATGGAITLSSEL
jgi:hypothetical protein